MKNFKKAYKTHLSKLRNIFPNESRETLEQMFVVMMRDENPIILSDSHMQIEQNIYESELLVELLKPENRHPTNYEVA